MSRRAIKKDLTRNQILSVTAKLFAEQGYENTSIDEIAKRAGIAKGTFYYHFDSKEDVVLALRSDSFTDTIESAFQALNSGSSPVRIMEQVFLDRAAWTEKHPELTKVFFEQRIHQFLFRENDAYVFPGINSRLSEKAQPEDLLTQSIKPGPQEETNGKGIKKDRIRFFQLIYELVTAAQAKKEIRQDIDSSELTQIIIATFIHAQGSWIGGYSGVSLIDKVHRWFHAILDGLYDQSFNADHVCNSLNSTH